MDYQEATINLRRTLIAINIIERLTQEVAVKLLHERAFRHSRNVSLGGA